MRSSSLTALGCLAVVATALACAGYPRPPAASPHPQAPAAPPPGPIAASPRVADAGVPQDAGLPDGEPSAALATDPAPDVLIHPVGIEDPSGKALASFHRALQRAARGEGKARIAFYGASHVASDLFTEVIRDRLQTRFGDAGPGALMPAKPWNWHRHAAAEYVRQRAFEPRRVKARAPRDDDYGLMGVAFESGRLRAIGKLRTRTHGEQDGIVDSFELYYLKQPGGGRVRVFIDGKGVRTLKTHADRPSPAYARFEVPEGQHEFELRTQADGPVRVFSVVAERSGPGVVLDTLGIPGARARYHLQWRDPAYAAHLARRNPDLVVLAYGTNESGDDDVPIETYEARLRKVLRRVAAIVPNASCLLVGPSDRPTPLPNDADEPAAQAAANAGAASDGGDAAQPSAPPPYAPRPRTGAIVDAQRRISAEFGCGFFDLVAFMGGPMSMLRWVAADPALGAPDHVHFTRTGYEALGEQLHQALLVGYTDPGPSTDPAGPGDTMPVPGGKNAPDATAAVTAGTRPDSPQTP